MNEQEPWRIDKDSVHFKVLKGWLSERFRIWLSRACAQYNLSEDELLTRIIETIRRISWKVFEILQEETGEKVSIPIIIISDAPGADLTVLSVAMDSSFDFLDKAGAEKRLSFLVFLFVARERLSQALREFEDKPRSFGNAGERGIAVYDQPIMYLFNLDYSHLHFLKKGLLKTVIEEAFHYFCIKTGEFNDKEIMEEKVKRVQNLVPEERDLVLDEIERKHGVKQMVEELFRILEQEDDLFSLLPI